MAKRDLLVHPLVGSAQRFKVENPGIDPGIAAESQGKSGQTAFAGAVDQCQIGARHAEDDAAIGSQIQRNFGQRLRSAAAQPLGQAQRKAPGPGQRERIAVCQLRQQRRRYIGIAAQSDVQRHRHHRPPCRIDSDPVAVERHVFALDRAEIGVGSPAGSGNQTRGVAQAAQRWRLVGKGPVAPRQQGFGISGVVQLTAHGMAHAFDQRILPARLRAQPRKQQPFAQAEAGDDDPGRRDLER